MKYKLFIILNSALLLALIFSTPIFAKHPDCTPDAYPGRMAYVYLERGKILNSDTKDFAKTKVKRLASEKIGKDLYRQVHLITFTKKNGEQITVITLHDASSEECSISDVAVYVVSKKLGDYQGSQ